jgi:hypothetical protein
MVSIEQVPAWTYSFIEPDRNAVGLSEIGVFDLPDRVRGRLRARAQHAWASGFGALDAESRQELFALEKRRREERTRVDQLQTQVTREALDSTEKARLEAELEEHQQKQRTDSQSRSRSVEIPLPTYQGYPASTHYLLMT